MNCRIFIVDDSKVLCNHLLEKFNDFKDLDIVGIAHNFSDAIKLIDQSKPDVTILDIQLPGGSGIGILDHIKKKQLSNKVIIFTNYPYSQYRQRCMEVGADFFFDKHTEFNELFKVVKKFIKEFKT
ncbi:MAG: response regulator, partial [Candidatus Aminicenantes bacterium]|nr:response regulator [Candidatus Aminicenantes bacterium]